MQGWKQIRESGAMLASTCSGMVAETEIVKNWSTGREDPYELLIKWDTREYYTVRLRRNATDWH